MRAEILAVGSELLDPVRQETNGTHITRKLLEVGVEVGARITVADDLALLTSAFRTAWSRADLVIATGGLGPTEDDLTREAAAAALGRPLVRQQHLVDELKARFARFGRVMAPVNEKQADVIEGGTVMPNARGSAPGQWLQSEGRLVFLLPGPPGEMSPMFEEQVLPVVRARAGGSVIRRRILRIAGMGESDVEQIVAPVYKTFSNPRTTILGGASEVELQLVAQAPTEAEAEERIEALAAGLRAVIPGRIHSEDGSELHQVVAALLKERRLRVALAESCTGGMLAARLTSVPGASAFFERGCVTYSNASKSDLLGVDPRLIEAHGAVSEEVARAMAEGARKTSGADLAVAITGIAGPDGGSPEKPVGLVFIALAGAAGDRVRRLQLIGDRDRIRRQACVIALEMVRRGLLGLGAS
jgi:competence/damage-inducible protein CinA-like protein